MFGNHFYHSSIKRAVSVFGTLFNNIEVKRESGEFIKVPLAYGPRSKWIARLQQQASLGLDGTTRTALSLPRMGFEISEIAYDGSRKLTKVQKFKSVQTGADGKVMNYNYMPVPYNISYNLFCLTATAEGGLQIIEQILPYFQPDYTVTVNVIPEMGIKRDIPIVLNNISYEDSYSGDFTTRRAVIYTLNFTAKTYLYGPASTQKVIKETQSDLHTDLPAAAREERIVVVPNPTSADADDDFGFTTTITNYADGKNYDKVRDEDV